MNDSHDSVDCVDNLKECLEDIAKGKGYVSFVYNVTEKFSKGENYLGEIRRVKLNGVKDDGTNEELNLIVKIIPPQMKNNEDFPLERLYDNEVYMYNTYLPALLNLQEEVNALKEKETLLKIAKFYPMANELNKDTLIFDDLNLEGYVMYDRFKSFDKTHLMLATKTLGCFHALSFALKDKLPREEYEKHLDFVHQIEQHQNFQIYIKESATNILAFVDSEENRRKFKKVIDEDLTKDFLHTLEYDKTRKYNILTHGDFWINNLLFRYEDGKPCDLIVLDWQIPKLATPIVDLLYLLYTCIDEDTRTLYWDEVLNIYYDTLRTRLISLNCDPDVCFPEEAFREELKEYHGFAIVNSVIMLPFILNRKEDSIDLNDLKEGGVENFSNVMKYSDLFKKRFNEVLRHLVKYEVL